MKLHAGSLYKNYLVLYGESRTRIVVQVDDSKLQWKLYCNDVEFQEIDSETGNISLENEYPTVVKYWETTDPMKFLGFGQ